MTTGHPTDEAIRRQALSLGSATLYEAAGKIGALPPRIGGLSPSLPVYGSAFPVLVPPGDNIWIHRAIYEAKPAEVLVVSAHGALEFGYFGEVMARAAKEKNIAGLVIDGCVRDTLAIIETGFPVFSSGRCVRGTGKRGEGGSMGSPVCIGDVTIRRGDIVVGDWDGVIVLPRESFTTILSDGAQRVAHEQQIFKRLAAGESTLAILDL